MEVVQNNQVAIINNSIELFKSAPQILEANQERTSKALAVGKTIIDQWNQAWAIADEEQKLAALLAADERSNKYLVNCGIALKEEKESRAAITQMMDEFKKMFTSAENDIDKAKAGTIPASIQSNRDAYAQESYKIAERKRKEAEREQHKKQEAIEIKATVETRSFEHFNAYLLKAKTWLTGRFNALVLDGFADAAAEIRLYDPIYKMEHFASFNPNVFSNLQSPDELKSIIEDALIDKFDKYSGIYKTDMLALKAEIVDKIPSKHSELLEQKRLADEAAAAAEAARIAQEKRLAEIAAANAADKERLEKEAAIAKAEEDKKAAELKAQQEAAAAEQKRREDEESAKIAAKAEEDRKLAEQEAEIKKQGEKTMAMFEKEAMIAEAPSASESRKGYEITVTHQAGWVQIFQLWFENEGKNLPIDKIGNTKLDQMKAWAEKQATKSGTKIESKFLKYDESFKAVNRKP